MASKQVCKYGASCYRKNPDHLKHYCHPGRDDDEEGGEDQSRGSRRKERGKRRGGGRPANDSDSEATETSTESLGTSVQSPPKGGGTITSYFERQTRKEKEKKGSKRSPHVHSDSGEEVDESKESSPPPAKRRKQEAEISSSKEKEESSVADPDELSRETEDIKENVKRKFLVQMPEDFYQFWEFCKSLKPSDPQAALELSLGLALVGPYDVLSGKLKGVPWEKCVLHRRHFYDPPEMVTVLEAVSDDLHGFHIGYFRDVPGDLTNFWLVSNSTKKDCEIKIEGRSIFSAVRSLTSKKLEEKSLSLSQRKQLTTLLSLLDLESSKLGLSHLPLKEMSKQRSKDVVTKCFHKMGIVVPYDMKTELGYRPLPLTDRELWKLLNKIANCSGDKPRCDQAFEPLQEIITFVQFANDECDYGMGLELGLNLFSHGNEYFHNVISHLLPLAYDLLQREEYVKILQQHLRERNQAPLDFRH